MILAYLKPTPFSKKCAANIFLGIIFPFTMIQNIVYGNSW